MSRFPRFIRCIAVASLLLSAGWVVSAPEAMATDRSVTELCVDSPNPSHSGFDLANGETFTITIGSSNCVNTSYSYFSGSGATVTINGNLVSSGSSNSVSNGDVFVITAPISGKAALQLGFTNVGLGRGTQYYFAFGYPAISASIADNGNGSLTFTYTGQKESGDPYGGLIYLWLLSEGSTCPADRTTYPATGYELVPNPFFMATSPAIVTAGDPASWNAAGYVSLTIPDGTYEACAYTSDGAMDNSPKSPDILVDSMQVSLGTAAPSSTTTTTVPESTTTTTVVGSGSGSGSGAGSGSGSGSNGNGAEAGSPSGDAVAPAFTG